MRAVMGSEPVGACAGPYRAKARCWQRLVEPKLEERRLVGAAGFEPATLCSQSSKKPKSQRITARQTGAKISVIIGISTIIYIHRKSLTAIASHGLCCPGVVQINGGLPCRPSTSPTAH